MAIDDTPALNNIVLAGLHEKKPDIEQLRTCGVAWPTLNNTVPAVCHKSYQHSEQLDS